MSTVDLVTKDTAHIAGQAICEMYARCFGETDDTKPYLAQDEEGWFVEESRYK